MPSSDSPAPGPTPDPSADPARPRAIEPTATEPAELDPLSTELCRRLGIAVPIIGAPMGGVAHGALTRAISAAGGLGVLGVGNSVDAAFVRREAAIAAGADGDRLPFGIGLQLWSMANQPDVFEETVAARPSLISLSFGDPEPYVEPCHSIGALVAAQVNTVEDAFRAAAAGVDILVAQGTEAGGHTGSIGTLPLLQAVLEAEPRDTDGAELPVVAAGGIGTGRGLAAVLAAGAQAAWIGTRFLVATEAANSEAARQRVVDADETRTVHTRVFDLAQGLRWPERYPGRALVNTFSERWHGREEALEADRTAAGRELAAAREHHDFDTAFVYAGQAVALTNAQQPAAEIVEDLAAGARARFAALAVRR